jgi:hypothetical protein
LDLINLKSSKLFEDYQKLLVELKGIVQLLTAYDQEVNIPSNWLMVEQKLTKPILRQMLSKKEEIGTRNWNMDHFLSNLKTIIRKEEVVHKICFQSHPKEKKGNIIKSPQFKLQQRMKQQELSSPIRTKAKSKRKSPLNLVFFVGKYIGIQIGKNLLMQKQDRNTS